MKKIKVVLYGETNVGKTQVLNRLLAKDFVSKHTPTIAAVPKIKKYIDANLQVQYVDLGHNVDEKVLHKCLSTADQICLVFNMQDGKDLASRWDMNYLTRTAPNARIILIGTHHNEDAVPAVSEQMVFNFIASFHTPVAYTKVSSKNNTGFEDLSARICTEVQEVEDDFARDTESVLGGASVIADYSQLDISHMQEEVIQRLKKFAAGDPRFIAVLDKYVSERFNDNPVFLQEVQRLALSPVKRDPLGTPLRNGGIDVLSPARPPLKYPSSEELTSQSKPIAAQPFWTVVNPQNMQPRATSFHANFWLRAMQFFLILGGIMAIVALLTCAPAAAALGVKSVLGVAAQDISATATFGALTSLLTGVGLYAARQMSGHPIDVPSNNITVPAR